MKTKNYIVLLFIAFLAACSTKSGNESKKNDSPDIEPGTKLYHTQKLLTSSATKELDFKKLDKTKYAFKKGEYNEIDAEHIIKISDKNVIILDGQNNISHKYLIVKKWIDELGPSTEYKIQDSTGTYCLLSHHIDIDSINYLAFRFGKSLNTYSGKNNK